MHSRDIRERFLRYFEERGHQRLPSSSLIPHDDPSLLFTVAGMVPLKAFFLGERVPPAARATTCQKVFRTVDIEEVGRTPRHCTFFEMLGNFSFGDYFKEGAITLAWEFLTGPLGLPVDRLWPSIHPGDAAALTLWKDTIGVPDDRIIRLEDNFWETGAGLPGPCGYDSEIYWDRQRDCSCGRPTCLPGCDGDRWVEVWNLVFMEFDRSADGRMDPLPRPSIDTGMGMERIAAVVQDRATIFDTDLFTPLLEDFGRRSTADLPEGLREVSLRVCADHLRASSFLIGDGVFPSNEGRGYVLRRLIRRAGLHGRRLGLEGGLAAGVARVVEVMGGHYTQLSHDRAVIERTLRAEEDSFARTLEGGTDRLASLLEMSSRISGEDAFRLYDTYGLPVELTIEIARDRGASVDREGFEAAMAEQRARSKAAAHRVGFEGGPALPPTTFVGYDMVECDAVVSRIGVPDEVEEISGGESSIVTLDRSPFYAEAGGQIGDTGILVGPDGTADVVDTTTIPGSDGRAHHVRMREGSIRRGQTVRAIVDEQRRAQVARHHSATHLLHKALREVLGDTVVQRGSFVGPQHTTFDFAFARALDEKELIEVERRVNAAIRANHERDVALLPLAQARASGAVALFGERYGDTVRVVDFGGWARELCGGTHVTRTGDVGAAIIVAEGSVGQGIRRIEMVVGEAAERRWRETGVALRDTARALRSRPDEVPERVGVLQAQVRRLSRDLDDVRRRGPTGPLEVEVESIGRHRMGHVLDPSASGDAVVALVDRIVAEKLQGDGVAVAVGADTIVVKVGGTSRRAGVSAGDLVSAAAAATGGRGGGRPDFGRGSVKDPDGRERAVGAVRDALAQAASDS